MDILAKHLAVQRGVFWFGVGKLHAQAQVGSIQQPAQRVDKGAIKQFVAEFYRGVCRCAHHRQDRLVVDGFKFKVQA